MIKNFEDFNEKLNSKKVILNDYIIYNFIHKSRGNLRKVLKLISERLTNEYITLYHEDCKDIIDDLKSLEFSIKIYDDSNDYSDNFDGKIENQFVTISWTCDFENTIDNDDDDDDDDDGF